MRGLNGWEETIAKLQAVRLSETTSETEKTQARAATIRAQAELVKERAAAAEADRAAAAAERMRLEVIARERDAAIAQKRPFLYRDLPMYLMAGGAVLLGLALVGKRRKRR